MSTEALNLATTIYRNDILANDLIPTLCGFFYGTLEVRLEASHDDETFTTLLRPGVALIHISLPTACEAAGYKTQERISAGNDTKRAAILIKRAIMTLTYHEIGHLLFTDMSGDQFKPFNNEPGKRQFIHDVANILEDVAMERNCMGKHSLYKFSRRYFKWMDREFFRKRFQSYKDQGTLSSFLNYLLGYCRITGKRMPCSNAMFDLLAKKGLIKKLRDAHRERDGVVRCAKQIAIAEWMLQELGITSQQLQQQPTMMPQRPIIILVDPQSGGKKPMKQTPMDAPLPPISIVEAGKGDKGDNDNKNDEKQKPIIIDARKNKPKPEKDDKDGEGEGSSPESDQKSENGSQAPQKGEESQDGEKGDQEGEGNGERQGDEDTEGDGGAEEEGEQQSSSSQAGTSHGQSSGGSKNVDGVELPEIDGEDPLSIGDDDFSDAMDRQLAAALAIDDAGGKAFLAKRIATPSPNGAAKSIELLNDAKRMHGKEISALATAIEEMKAETAPKTRGREEEGDDLDVDAYLDSIITSTPTIEIFEQEIPGREITDLAVSILVDVSGSMEGYEDQCAHLACCMVAQACERALVPLEIECFSYADVFYLKEFDDELSEAARYLGFLRHDMFGSYSFNDRLTCPSMWGGTNCEQATRTVIERLKLYEGKEHKLLFVITDGGTGSPITMGEIVSKARADGIGIIGIGIGTSEDSLRKCFGRCKAFDANSLETLPDYVSKEIRLAIGKVE